MADPVSRTAERGDTPGNTFTGPTAAQIGDGNTQHNTFAVVRPPVSWPHQVGVLPRQADCFQDRQASGALDAAVADGGTVVLCQVLSGTGGAGKSQLAAEYARRRVLGPGVDTLSSRQKLAHWRGRAGDAAAAVAELTELLADLLQILDPDHQETLTARCTLAYWRCETGDINGAITETEALLDDVMRLFGPDNRLALTARRNLARLRAEGGNAADASATSSDDSRVTKTLPAW